MGLDVRDADGQFCRVVGAGRRFLALAIVALSALLLTSPRHIHAQPPAPEPPSRVVAAVATSLAATFASKQPGAEGVKVLPAAADLYTGDMLITLPGAALRGKNGAVSLKSLADYDGRSPFPTLETAFTLNDAKTSDLDVTLDRGRIDLTNTKAAGAAVVRVRFWDQVWTITLDAPGTRVGLELYGRWPSGSQFQPAQPVAPSAPRKPPAPVASLVLLVVSGSASTEVSGGLTLGLKAPPGPALLGWDSIEGSHPQPQKLEQSPAWADPDASLSSDGKLAAAAVERFRLARVESPSTAISTFLNSTDPFEQRVGLVSIGATDDLTALIKELSGAKTPVEWDFGIRVARHWLGRCPGHDQKMYAALISPVHGYTPAQARIIMKLLFGFSADELGRSETYEVLIDYLTHDQSTVRNLAAWHLVRAVPQGKTIGYTPGATKAECETAAREWKKLVPSGQLPPPPPKKD